MMIWIQRWCRWVYAGGIAIVGPISLGTVGCGDSISGPNFVAGEKVYVANTGSNSVSVIDAWTERVQHTIELGMPPYAIAASKTGPDVYVSSRDGRAIIRIDALTDRVVRTFTVQEPPSDLNAGYDGNVYFVVEPRPFVTPLRVGRLNPSGNTVDERAIEFKRGPTDNWVETTPFGQLVVANTGDTNADDIGPKLSFLSLASIVADTVITENVMTIYTGAAVGTDGKTIFGVETRGAGSIHKIDLPKYLSSTGARWRDANTVIRLDIPETIQDLFGLAVDPRERSGYVASNGGGMVYAVSLATGAVLASARLTVGAPGGTSGRVIGLAAEGQLVFASLYHQDAVAILSADGLAVRKTIAVGTNPTCVAVVR